MLEKIVRIGGASGSMIDSAIAVPQLLTVPGINYLIFDSCSRIGGMRYAFPPYA